MPGDWRRAVDPQAVEDRLRKDAKGGIKAVLMVQVDTASSVVNDVAAVRQAIDAAGHDALYMVDTIASLATMPFEMDAWGVDVAVGGSQKGLMTPPGLGFNAASEKARAAHRKADLVTRYWDWSFRDGEEHYMKYCGTPPEHLMFGLRAALDMILEEGLEKVIRRHRHLAEAVRAAVEAWSEGQVIGFNVLAPAHRSNSVTTVLTQGHAPQKLIDFARDGCGVTLGVSLGGPGHEAFRIAHMGHVNAAMVLATLGVVEAGLVALGIPHGARARAAIDSIARALAN
jgi:alanine-glyoxylate transaminase/serine-glyoxylate transaminase/serine-pyruvate transaminase